ncbi:putative tilB protein [Blattamonas nauphoetae]|uniref:TilB protein n=1 Tax=Blattamonas nauphoetae TaxID=2049346 RepID=A0ABQ9XQN7_9EUKA|nr:putative tilB protein [Blattamonas nauphoetae]
MVRITEDLLRKRSEHNEGVLSDLEEIALHQFDIEKIELIDRACPKLQILLMQNNLVGKIEGLNRLHQLRYLNLTLNLITRIENLGSCEDLNKLDLTCNFIVELTTVESLSHLHHFQILYLTGNPCTTYTDYRDYVISVLPHLQELDGEEVTKTERLKAESNKDRLRSSIVVQQEEGLKKFNHAREKQKRILENEERKAKEKEQREMDRLLGKPVVEEPAEVEEGTIEKEEDEDDGPPPLEEPDPFNYVPEVRLQAHHEIQRKKEEEDPETKKKKMEKEKQEREREEARKKLVRDDGTIIQKNEGQWDFRFYEDTPPGTITLEIKLSRYLDVSLMKTEVHPSHVMVEVKGKVLQLKYPFEVQSDKAEASRSDATGVLRITVPKVNPKDSFYGGIDHTPINLTGKPKKELKDMPLHSTSVRGEFSNAALDSRQRRRF